MLAQNIMYLKRRFPIAADAVQVESSDPGLSHEVRVVETRSGTPSLEIRLPGRELFLSIHSKYNPVQEAETLLRQFEDIGQYEHVLFFGMGLGYHIDLMIRQHPSVEFSVIEPSREVFRYCLENRDLSRWTYLQHLVVGTGFHRDIALERMAHSILNRKILLIVLPSYQRIFQDDFEGFQADFRKLMELHRSRLHIEYAFGSRWVYNSMLNLPVTLKTPNILDDHFKRFFHNKPLIIVSAGPSLQYEYENLRKIKEKGLAYIFAAGSGAKALVNAGILPDAICTYDPQEFNHYVLKETYELGITSVPLIYGTSVGFETLERYRGPKLHMITARDTVTPYYVNEGKSMKSVRDAPTIAAVTYELACKLGCSPILFAGQNLAMLNNEVYASQVNKREESVRRLTKTALSDGLTVKDVFGKVIVTTSSFLQMKETLEQYIAQAPSHIETINTTKGGADIAGARFMPLEEWLASRPDQPVVEEGWYEQPHSYDTRKVHVRKVLMEKSIRQFQEAVQEFRELVDKARRRKAHTRDVLINAFNQMDKRIHKMHTSDVFRVLIQPSEPAAFERMHHALKSAIRTSDLNKRLEIAVEQVLPYFEKCVGHLSKIRQMVHWIHRQLDINTDTEVYYPNHCGAYQYTGTWERSVQFRLSGESEIRRFRMKSAKRGASIQFLVKGSGLTLYFDHMETKARKIQLSVDGKEKAVPFIQMETEHGEWIYRMDRLNEERETRIELKLTEDEAVAFNGISMPLGGRIYHPDEVERLEDLTVGKRIRCHYKADFDQVGQFDGFGKETLPFISPWASAAPDGDFYWVMVDETEGSKKLIADRNIQHSVSWNTLYEAGVATAKGMSIGKTENRTMSVRLIQSGLSRDDTSNEWTRYIQNAQGDFNHENYWCFAEILVTLCFADINNPLAGFVHRGRFVSGETPYGEDAHYYHFVPPANNDKKYHTYGFRPLLLIKHE